MITINKSFDLSQFEVPERGSDFGVDLSAFDLSLDSFDFEPTTSIDLSGLTTVSESASASGLGFASAGGFGSASGSGFSSVSGSSFAFVAPDGTSGSSSTISATGDTVSVDAFAFAGPTLEPAPTPVFDIALSTIDLSSPSFTPIVLPEIEMPKIDFSAFDFGAFDWGV
ncbi:MAG: hypothetical protein AAFP78_16040 [Pseudomonadota bacterium]